MPYYYDPTKMTSITESDGSFGGKCGLHEYVSLLRLYLWQTFSCNYIQQQETIDKINMELTSHPTATGTVKAYIGYIIRSIKVNCIQLQLHSIQFAIKLYTLYSFSPIKPFSGLSFTQFNHINMDYIGPSITYE